MKKSLRLLSLAALCAGAALFAAPALAAHGHGGGGHGGWHGGGGHGWHGGHGHYGHYHGYPGWGWFGLGLSFGYPGYYDPGYYNDGPYYQGPYYRPPDANDVPDGYSWYHCGSPEGFYPYVQSCGGPWQRVAPNVVPPGGAYHDGPHPDDRYGPDDRNDGPPPPQPQQQPAPLQDHPRG
jgi:hypothetical protein